MVLLAAPLQGQTAPTQLMDMRIQVDLVDQNRTWFQQNLPQRLRGQVVEASPDSVVLQIHPGVAPVRLSWDGVTRVEVSQGVPNRLESGIREGVTGGLILGLVVMALNTREDHFGATWKQDMTAAFGISFMSGILWPRERWRRVDVP